MRVVIDTNIFVSSFFGGNPRKIIQHWKDGNVTLCLSMEILDEYIEVLKRLGLDEEDEFEELISLFAKGFNIIFTTKTPKINIVNDPDDDKFIECAVALKAKVVISGDKALTAIGEYMGIEIVTPHQFTKDFKPKTEKKLHFKSVR